MKQEGQIKVQTPRRDFLKVSTAAYAAPIVLNAGRKTFGVSTSGELVGLPEIDTPTWGREPVKVETSRRATIRLNGIWPVFPAINDAHQQPTPDWATYAFLTGGRKRKIAYPAAQTRAPCQVHASLGGQFMADKLIFTVIAASAATQLWRFESVKQTSGFYCSDYRCGFSLGEDPLRYYNW